MIASVISLMLTGHGDEVRQQLHEYGAYTGK